MIIKFIVLPIFLLNLTLKLKIMWKFLRNLVDLVGSNIT